MKLKKCEKYEKDKFISDRKGFVTRKWPTNQKRSFKLKLYVQEVLSIFVY